MKGGGGGVVDTFKILPFEQFLPLLTPFKVVLREIL